MKLRQLRNPPKTLGGKATARERGKSGRQSEFAEPEWILRGLQAHSVSPASCTQCSSKFTRVGPADMAQYDLTSSGVKYLDRHLVFPLLEFLSQQQLYPEDDIQKGKLELLQKTNMVDYAMDIYKALYNRDDVPPEMRSRRHEVVHNLKSLQVLAQGAAPLDKLTHLRSRPRAGRSSAGAQCKLA